jgi:hypothetical protein
MLFLIYERPIELALGTARRGFFPIRYFLLI